MNRTSKKARRLAPGGATAGAPGQTLATGSADPLASRGVSAREFAEKTATERAGSKAARRYFLTGVGSLALPGIGTAIGALASWGLSAIEEKLYGADERALTDRMMINDTALAIYEELVNVGSQNPRLDADVIMASELGYWPWKSRAPRPKGAWYFNDDNRRVTGQPLPPRVNHFGSKVLIVAQEPVDTKPIWEGPLLARFPQIKKDPRGGYAIDVEHWDFNLIYTQAHVFADETVLASEAALPRTREGAPIRYRSNKNF